MAVLKHCACIKTLRRVALAKADALEDGGVNTADAVCVLKKSAGLN